MRSLEPKFDLLRPTLSKEQVAALRAGDTVRNIPGHVYHVTGFVLGKYGERVATLATWSLRHQEWFYVTATDVQLGILYTTA